jgi:hypothetical protein
MALTLAGMRKDEEAHGANMHGANMHGANVRKEEQTHGANMSRHILGAFGGSIQPDVLECASTCLAIVAKPLLPPHS